MSQVFFVKLALILLVVALKGSPSGAAPNQYRER